MDIGQYGKGNIDLYNRPKVKNEDGSISTVRSMSFYDEKTGKEVLVPTVHPEGRIMTNKEAMQRYYKTGEYLGMFDTPDEANSYADKLHNEQDILYSHFTNEY